MLNSKNKPWSKQSFAEKERIPGVNNIIDMSKQIYNDRDRCLFVLTYLTAGRLQELVRYTGKNGKLESIKAGDLQIKENIIENNGEKSIKKILLINLRNNKNKKRYRKDIPVPLNKPENVELFNLMSEHLLGIPDEDEVFPITYRRAYAILTKINNRWNPHWIRHIRLTHLVTIYGYREYQLTLYAGWSDPRPAKHYLQMRWEDLMY